MAMAMEGTVRLRLVFENHRHLLNKTYKSQGLKRSWILLKPEFETISDLSSYISHTFQLQPSCPNGVQLSMDGFFLPWFESTRIFKDEDIIRVKRKEDRATNVTKNANALENSEVVEKQPPLTGVKLLALEEFEKETGGNQSEPEENEYEVPENALPSETPSHGQSTSKKRKSFTKLQNAKKKRVRSPSPEQSLKVPIDDGERPRNQNLHHKGDPSKETSYKKDREKRVRSHSPEKSPPPPTVAVENDDHAKNQDCDHHGALSRKSSSKEHKSSKTNGKLKRARITDADDGVENDVESIPSEDRKKRVRSRSPEKSAQPPTVAVENVDHAKNQDCDNQGALSRKSSSKKHRSSKTNAKLKKAGITDADDGVENDVECIHSEDRSDQLQEINMEHAVSIIPEVPIKRPCRSARRKKMKRKWLQALRKEKKESLTRSNMPVESEPNKSQELKELDQSTDSEAELVPRVVKPGHIRFESIDEEEVIHQIQDPVGTFQWNGTMSKKRGQKWGMEKTSVSRSKNYEKSMEDSFKKTPVAEGELVHNSVDFEKLKPLSGLPKEGDVVAYRLVELSSTWCPELSPFRVGKVSSFVSESNWIMLVPVPGFPVVSAEKKDEEETAQETVSSLYKEDGSLEIDLVSLVDVRILDSGNLDTATVDGSKGTPASSIDTGSAAKPNANPEETTLVTDASNKASGSGVKSNSSNRGSKDTGSAAKPNDNSEETTVVTDASNKASGSGMKFNGSKRTPASNTYAGSAAKINDNSEETTVVTDTSNKASGSGRSGMKFNSSKRTPASSKYAGSAAKPNENSEGTTLFTDANNKASGSGVKSNGNHEESHAGNTGGDVWEEISKALNEKKSQLQKDVWAKKGNSGNGNWSHKALRSGALGPTMAILRAGNGK